MNSERYLFRRKLIEFLCASRPELTERLKDTPQLYQGQKSPYHMEDSVWTHTMMVLQAALDDPDSTPLDHLCALVHDFGKPYTAAVRERKDGRKYVSFHGHGTRGTQDAVDFLMDCSASLQPTAPEDIAGIAFCVSNHIDFYGLKSAEDAFVFCNRKPDLLRRLTNLFEYDVDGSIMDCAIPNYASNRELIAGCRNLLNTVREPEKTPLPERRIHLVCGLPSEGKRLTGRNGAGLCLADLLPSGASEEPMPEKEDSPGLRERAVEALKKKTDSPVLWLHGFFLTRHERKHMLSLLREAFPDVPVFCDYVLGRTAENQAWMAGLSQHLPAALYETGFSGIRIRVCQAQTER